jgi:putative ABC transport system permease protein
MYLFTADDQFLKTFEVSLWKGRNFSAANLGDTSAILINETAASVLGIKEPSEQMIEIPSIDYDGSVDNLDEPFRARVVGITKDFNFRSFREKVAPMIIAYQKNPVDRIDYFTARLATDNAEQALKQWKLYFTK